MVLHEWIKLKQGRKVIECKHTKLQFGRWKNPNAITRD